MYLYMYWLACTFSCCDDWLMCLSPLFQTYRECCPFLALWQDCLSTCRAPAATTSYKLRVWTPGSKSPHTEKRHHQHHVNTDGMWYTHTHTKHTHNSHIFTSTWLWYVNYKKLIIARIFSTIYRSLDLGFLCSIIAVAHIQSVDISFGFTTFYFPIILTCSS